MKRKYSIKAEQWFLGVQQIRDEKVFFLFCKQIRTVMKDCNVKHHYETNHRNNVASVDNWLTQKLEQLPAGLAGQQFVF